MAGFPKARVAGLLLRKLERETFVYDLEQHRATCLNEFAAAVLDLCDGTRDASDIAAMIPGADAPSVEVALASLSEATLVTNHTTGGRITRRQAMHGLATGAKAAAVLVPAITMIDVPVAAQALSCSPDLAPCRFNSDCCSGFCGADFLCAPRLQAPRL